MTEPRQDGNNEDATRIQDLSGIRDETRIVGSAPVGPPPGPDAGAEGPEGPDSDPGAGRRRTLMIVATAAAVALILLGTGLWMVLGRSKTTPVAKPTLRPSGSVSSSAGPSGDVAVPDVRRQQEAAATRTLTAAGLKPRTVTQVDTGQPDGTVLAVSPDPGSRVKPGSTITLRTAIRVATVPALTGGPVETARRTLTGLGLRPVTEQAPNTDPARSGRVVVQQPAAGKQVRVGTTVVLRYYASAAGPSPSRSTAPTVGPTPTPTAPPTPPTVSPTTSPDPETTPVPEVRGKSEKDARDALRAVGLSAVTETYPDGGRPDGTVADVIPGVGTATPKGSTVTLRVAVTMATVPDVRGMSVAEASLALNDAGLAVQAQQGQAAVGASDGAVTTQDPAAGTAVRRGTTVTLTYQPSG